jgi:hypothetical protein
LNQRERFLRLVPGAAPLHPPPIEIDTHALGERLDERLHPESVGEAWSAASNATEGREGEPERRRLRAIAPPFLARAAAPVDREIGCLVAEAGERPVDFPFRLERETDPERREAILRRWHELEARLVRPRRERLDACADRVDAAGAASLGEFVEALHPVSSRDVCERFGGGAIAPLDAAIAEAAVERYGGKPVKGVRDEATLPSPELLPEHAGLLDARRVRNILDALPVAAGFGRPAPRVLPAEVPDGFGAALPLATATGALIVGEWPGPGGLGRGLADYGSCLHAGRAAAWGDPAFEAAARVLFRRLLLSRPFLEWAGIEPESRLCAALRLEEAVAVREAWSYLYLALEAKIPAPHEADEVLLRATGRPPDPGRAARVLDRDRSGAAVLRGTVLALLVEERLLSRYGWSWFRERAAGLWLAGCLEGEAGETAESMSTASDLGTIEPTPILDRCRP